MIYIKSMELDQHIVGFYLCKEKQTLKTSRNSDYLRLTLEDKTGTINTILWDTSMVRTPFEKGDYVKVDGVVETHNGAPQLLLKQIRKAVDGDDFDPADYTRTSKIPASEYLSWINATIDDIQDPGLRKLCLFFFGPQSAFYEKLKLHPGAKNIHHGYLGGLCEHISGVTHIALDLLRQYPSMNRDLLVAGALLHDIGKLCELEGPPASDYTEEGRFIGHISLGYQMVHEAASDIPELDKMLLLQLEHMILSHHGEREFGSPVLPATMEAMALHLADLSDSKLKQMEEAIENDSNLGHWTAYNKVLERFIYKP